MSHPRRLLLLLLVLAALQAAYYYPQMPETMASHFRWDGRADGFQPRAGFFGVCALSLGLPLVIFLGLPALMARLPTSWFNLPNREYWLAPERRPATLDLLATRIQWFGVATTLLLVAVLHLVFEANRSPRPRVDPTIMWGLLVAYLGFTVVWLGWLFRTVLALQARRGPGRAPGAR